MDGSESQVINNSEVAHDTLISGLRTKRKSIRAVVTKLIKKIETELISDGDINADLINGSLKLLETKWKELKEIDEELLKYIDDNSQEFESEVFAAFEYEEKVHSCQFNAKQKLCLVNKSSVVDIEAEDNHSNSETNNDSSSVLKPDAKITRLPKLTIPKFYGDFTHWQSFWNSFKVAIDDNTLLTKTEKFNYLKSYLGGNAANVIEGFAISDDNYDEVISLLKSRFGRKEIIVNSHIEKLLNLTPVSKSSDTIKLRKLYDTIEIQVRSLNSLGVKPETYSSMLVPVIMKVLPSDITLEYYRKNGSSTFFDINHLLEFVQSEIECRERHSLLSSQAQPRAETNRYETNRYGGGYQPRKERKVSSAAELMTSVDENAQCLFCQNSHKSEACDAMSVEEKRDVLRRQGRCFLCLRAKHTIKTCKSNYSCSCKGRHNRAICYQLAKKNTDKGVSNNEPSQTLSALSVGTQRGILLHTCSGVLKKGENSIPVRMLLDNGSMRTFIAKETTAKLKLPVLRRETLTVYPFGNSAPIRKTFDVVRVRLENRESRAKYVVVEALVTEQISRSDLAPPDTLSMKGTFKEKLNDLQLADIGDSREGVTLLIGAYYYYRVATGKLRRLDDNLVIIETLFGWCFQGNCDNTSRVSTALPIFVEEDLSDISHQIKKFWELETLGIEFESQSVDPIENDVLKTFESNISFENGRYIVKLPWKDDKKILLQDNREVAYQRFERLRRRFQNDPKLFESYNAVIQDYLHQNIIEPVPDASSENSTIFYLPHHEVLRTDRTTTKLRIVFDASSHKPGEISLNDSLHVGPNLYPDIFDLLLNFRLYPVAFTGDLRQAFLQIEVDENDRDVSRFFFLKNPFDDALKPEVFRFTRVLFGVNCSPFLLAATIKHHLKFLENEFPETCAFLDQHIYVDDVIGGQEDVEKALKTSCECTEVFNRAGMTLHKWHTNSAELRSLWVKNDMIPGEESKPSEDIPLKVLGVSWNEKLDVISVDITNLQKFLPESADTKRFVLQAVGRIYDPLGLISPFVVRVKILIQQMWCLNLGWDEKLPDDLKKLWRRWCEEVSSLKVLEIPRHYFLHIDAIRSIELHCFSDASKTAYGTVVYLRVESTCGQYYTVFVASKSRVAPLKNLTLPRLELMGALLSAKLGTSIMKTLSLPLIPVFWTDAKIVLFWVKDCAKRFKPFVKNRVEEVQKLSAPDRWFHCPGKSNPADLVSRGAKVKDLVNNPIWLHGPEWLRMSQENWPPQDQKIEVLDDPEYRKGDVFQFQCTVAEEPLIEITKFGSLRKLIGVVSYVKRFIFNLKNPEKREGNVSAEELEEAKNYLIRKEQEKFYPKEIESLRKGENVPKKSHLYTLNPFLDENDLVRISSRLENSDFSYSEKTPVLLPGKSWLTELIVNAEHKKIFHGGVAATVTKVRSYFWIPRSRQVVKRILNKCLICRKYSVKPVQQKTSPLPEDRISQAPPFYVCGVDFAGPLYVRDGGNLNKAYICLFTCAVTRGIHLELVACLKTENFLLALRRFVARRGLCSIIYSDNAKTFKRADKELAEIVKILRSKGVQDYVASAGIKWKFIPEHAAWWGGFYERMVKSAKMCLKKVLGRALLNSEEMSTLLAEIEAALNSRPLTYVPNGQEEFDVLTPEHFLAGRNSILIPPLNLEHVLNSSTNEGLQKRRRYRELLLKQIWRKWKEQYLLLLRSAHHLQTPEKTPSVKIGDVVLIEDDKKPRSMWSLGRVIETIIGRDGLIRSCIVLTPKGLKLRRPIQHLYHLEMPLGPNAS